MLALPRLLVSLTLSDPGDLWRKLTVAVGVAGMFVGVTYLGLFRPSLEEYRHRLPASVRRCGSQAGFLVWCLAPLLVSASALTTYWAWPPSPPNTPPESVVLGLVMLGVSMHVLSWLVYSVALRRFNPGELAVTALTGGLAGLVVGFLATRVLPPAPRGRTWSTT